MAQLYLFQRLYRILLRLELALVRISVEYLDWILPFQAVLEMFEMCWFKWNSR